MYTMILKKEQTLRSSKVLTIESKISDWEDYGIIKEDIIYLMCEEIIQ